MSRIIIFLTVFFSYQSSAMVLDCSHFFEDDSTEQGGGDFYIKVKKHVFEVWLDPYDEEDESNPSILEATLKLVPSKTKTLKLYSDTKSSVTYEYVKVGDTNFGVLDMKSARWTRTYKCIPMVHSARP
ncbi:MAG TPA: hypothetical protein VNJ08_10780 [Bacteriovoracaceae bacterium]|nr:hypothetical protein [Bacteriovoracaceae bacterium]